MTEDTPLKKHFARELSESAERLRNFVVIDAPDCMIEEEIRILMNRGLVLFGTKIFEGLVYDSTTLARFSLGLCVSCGLDPFPQSVTNPHIAWCPACSAKQEIWERKNLPPRDNES